MSERMEREDAIDDELCYDDLINVCRPGNVEDISAADENVAPNSQSIETPSFPRRRAAEIQRNRK